MRSPGWEAIPSLLAEVVPQTGLDETPVCLALGLRGGIAMPWRARCGLWETLFVGQFATLRLSTGSERLPESFRQIKSDLSKRSVK